MAEEILCSSVDSIIPFKGMRSRTQSRLTDNRDLHSRHHPYCGTTNYIIGCVTLPHILRAAILLHFEAPRNGKSRNLRVMILISHIEAKPVLRDDISFY